MKAINRDDEEETNGSYLRKNLVELLLLFARKTCRDSMVSSVPISFLLFLWNTGPSTKLCIFNFLIHDNFTKLGIDLSKVILEEKSLIVPSIPSWQ